MQNCKLHRAPVLTISEEGASNVGSLGVVCTVQLGSLIQEAGVWGGEACALDVMEVS